MFKNVLPFRSKNGLSKVSVYTNDWSYRDDLADAPTLAHLNKVYEELLGRRPKPCRKVINRARQLEIEIPVNDIVGVDAAVRRLFRGENIIQDIQIWTSLIERFKPIVQAHNKANPAFYFTPVGAAIAAVSTLDMSNTKSDYTLALEGYTKVSRKKVTLLKGKQSVKLGKAPTEKPLNGAFLFQFKDNDDQAPYIAQAVLVDIRGVFNNHIEEAIEINNYHGNNPLVLISGNHNRLPKVFL